MYLRERAMELDKYTKAKQLLDAIRGAGWVEQASQIELGFQTWLEDQPPAEGEVSPVSPFDPDPDAVLAFVFDAMVYQLFEDVFHLDRSQKALRRMGNGGFTLDLEESFGLTGGSDQLETLKRAALTFTAELHRLVFVDQEPSPGGASQVARM